MSKIVAKRFVKNDTWTCPAGVTSVTVTLKRRTPFFNRIQHSSTDKAGFLDKYGNAYAWGQNSFGSLGTNDITPKSSPTLVVGGLKFVKHYSNNVAEASLGITDRGDLYAWGPNSSGQLGDNTVVSKSSPVAVSGGLKFIDCVAANVTGSSGVTFGITTSGNLFSWGNATGGVLGDGTTTPKSSPTLVVGGLKWKNINPRDGGSVLGIATNGNMYGWGLNTNGSLGDGTTTPRSSPTLVVGGLSWLKLDLSKYEVSSRTGAITTSGDMYMWGYNDSGQIGDGTTTPKSSPTLVVGGLKFKDLAVGATTYGLTTANQLYAWGLNNFGQLGDNSTTNRSSPVAVLGGLKFAKIGMNSVYTAAWGLTFDGTLYAWGQNNFGQLGVGDFSPRSSPVAVVGGLKFSDIFPGGIRMLAIATDGQLYAWGYNSDGQVGDGTTNNQNSPVVVLNNCLALDDGMPSKIISVTPGTAYAVRFNQIGICFGTERVASGIFDEIILQYKG